MASEISSAFGFALTSLRMARGWTQKRLGQAAGIAKSLVTRYEQGRDLIRETLDRLLGFLGYPREAADAMVFAHRLIFPDPLEDAASPLALTPEERREIDRACLATGLLAAEEMRAELIREKKLEKAEAWHREAEGLWERLRKASPTERRDAVAVHPEHRSWALAVRACEASIRAAARSAKESRELADLALFIAERVPEPEAFRSRLLGYCWAHVGNSRRVSEDYDGADEAFARAWDLWHAGSDSDPELLPEWRLLSLEASLRRAERRFPQALEVLDRARRAAGEDPAAAGRILLKKEMVLNYIGDLEGALAALAEAAPLVEASGNRDLLYALRFNMTEDLCVLDRYGEAAAWLPQVRELALDRGERELSRVLWLQAKLDAGQGRLDEAVRELQLVRRDFLDHDLPYNAALASLDLAVLWLRADNTVQVRELAAEMAAVFRAKKIHREALAALLIFCEAARRETATVELARRALAEIEKVRRSASPAE